MKRFAPLLIFLVGISALLWFLDVNRRSREKTEKAVTTEVVAPEGTASEASELAVRPLTDTVPGRYRAMVTLTPAESKRLIAIGLLSYPPFAEQLEKGEILVTKGTTNHYIAETLLNRELVPGSFTTGRIAPANSGYGEVSAEQETEFFFNKGVWEEHTFEQSLDKLREGSIILKGANLINYSTKKAAVVAGSETGGTTAMILPYIGDGKAKLIIPVGLEKNSSYDIDAVVAEMQVQGQGIPRLYSLPGEIFTEIEAIKQFSEVEVFQIASGGVGGAEGAVTLIIQGTQGNVMQVMHIIESVQGEPPFFGSDGN